MARLPAIPALAVALATLVACNPAPDVPTEGVTFRDPGSDGGTSGERGNVRISEIFWSGSVADDGTLDPTDQFVEIRNEGTFPVNLSGWRLVISGSVQHTVVLPATDAVLQTGDHAFVATKSTGCFPEPDFVAADLSLPIGGPVYVKLLDLDEHLIDAAGDREQMPFAGGYDGVRSRSMERVELMFGGESTQPNVWHFYTPAQVSVPNNDRVADGCRAGTFASPGRPNSPDYSGAYASGSLD